MARDRAGAETVIYEQMDVLDTLQEMTGGRGPDACIDAAGMAAHGHGLMWIYDRAMQAARIETDRGTALREAIVACRNGGTVAILLLLPLEQAPHGYDIFKLKLDECEKVILKPGQSAAMTASPPMQA